MSGIGRRDWSTRTGAAGRALFKVGKAVVKGGSIAAEFQGVYEDAKTLVGSESTLGERAWAGLSLATEIWSPVSIGDAKAAASFAMRHGDDAARLGRRLPFNDPERLAEINNTLDRIDGGGPFLYKKDGTIFHNKEGLLPQGKYREYTVTTPGAADRGRRRVLIDEEAGRAFYTDDHYLSFVQIER